MTFRYQKRWCDACKQMQPADHKHPKVEVRETLTALTHPAATMLVPKAYYGGRVEVNDTASVVGTCNHCGAKVTDCCPYHPNETLNSVRPRHGN